MLTLIFVKITITNSFLRDHNAMISKDNVYSEASDNEKILNYEIFG